MAREGYYITFGVSASTFEKFQDIFKKLVLDKEPDPAIKFVYMSLSHHKKLRLITEEIEKLLTEKE